MQYRKLSFEDEKLIVIYPLNQTEPNLPKGRFFIYIYIYIYRYTYAIVLLLTIFTSQVSITISSHANVNLLAFNGLGLMNI